MLLHSSLVQDGARRALEALRVRARDAHCTVTNKLPTFAFAPRLEGFAFALPGKIGETASHVKVLCLGCKGGRERVFVGLKVMALGFFFTEQVVGSGSD